MAFLTQVFAGCATLITLGMVISNEAEAQSMPPHVATVCAPCHGLSGIGHDVEIPNLAGQHDVYLRNQLKAFKSGRRKHPEMAYISHKLTDQEINEIVGYYSKLRPH